MPQFQRRPLAAAILMMFSTPLALAQSMETTLPEVKVRERPGDDFKADTTRGGTRTETPLRDIPQFINIVPQSVIQSQGARTLQDALRNVPGITYAAPEGGTQANQIFYMRGFQSGGNLFLDAVRDIGEYNRDLFAIDSVEVLKGPGGLMFGRGSTAGVINQVSKYADLLSRKDVDLTLGSLDTKRATADLNMPLSQTSAVRLVALAEDSGWYRYPQDVEKLGFAPSLRFGIGTGTDVTLAYYYLKTSDVTDYGQPVLITGNTVRLPPVDARAFYGFANDYTDHDTHIATFIVDHKFSRDVSLRNTLRWANYKREIEATLGQLNGKDANGKAVTAATPLNLLLASRAHTKARDNDDHVLINQTEVTWKIATGAVKHTVLGGMELAREELDRVNYNFCVPGTYDPIANKCGANAVFPTTPMLAPNPYDPIAYQKAPNTRSLSEASTVAFYAQDQIEFTPQWKGVFGLRWERYDSEVVTAKTLTGEVTSGPFGRVDNMLSGRAGLIWQPTNAQSYYVSYGTSYNPSGELGVYGATATNLNAQTQLLEPEKNRNYEVGAQWDFFEDTRLRAALFRNEKTNARIDVDPSAITTTALAGKQRVDGLELELAGRVNRSWDVFGAYAYMDGKVLDDPNGFQGNKMIVPEHSGSLWSVYRLGGGWEVGGGLFAASEQFINFANTVAIPGYWRWDATVAYVQKKYEVRLNVLNLTDELYYIGGYQNSGNRVLPANPRTTLVTFRYKFD